MAKENAIAVVSEETLNAEPTESFDLDDLEEKLQNQLDEELSELQFLEEEKKKIGSPDNLGQVMMDVVWEQFLNQVAATAGEDFIKENRGLTLDLRKEAHFQTTENFEKGKIATHNTEIDYQERYDTYQSSFKKDKDGNIVTHKTRSGKDEATLVKGARKPFDEGRPSGSAEKHTDMDHTISAGEILRDPAANAHLSREEQIEFANSDANLYEMDSSLNRSKGDMSTTEFLDTPNANGQKPREIYDLSKDEEAKMRQKNKEAREEYKKRIKAGEQRSIEAGKKSQKAEAFRISGKALRAAIMQMLADLLREIMTKLVAWFKSANRELKTLLESIKDAIRSFITNIKTHLINAGNSVLTTVLTAIWGPIFRTIKKIWSMLKQGWQSLKNAIYYLKDPANKNKPMSIKLMEVGKIIIAGVAAGASLPLSEVIEKGLSAFPIFAFEIPLLGSLASILGIFLGAVVAGIIGAIGINLIDKLIENRLKRDNITAQIEKGNEILNLQHKVQLVRKAKFVSTKTAAASSIYNRHVAAANEMKNAIENITANCETDMSIQESMDDIDALLDELKD